MVKYLDFIGLSLYNDLSKKYIDNKDITTQIINELLSGKDTLVIVPGAYNPTTGVATQTTIKVNIDNDTIKFKNVAGTYSAEEAATANAALEGALLADVELTSELATAYNTAVDGANKQAGDTLTTKEATMYNATLAGAIQEGDAKTPDWKLAVSDEALIQYVGGNGINISAAVNGEKTVSAVIKDGDKILSVDANGIQSEAKITKLTPETYDVETGHQSGDFATRFGTNVKEAYVLTGINGQQIGTDADAVLIYKDSSIVSIDWITSYVDDQEVTHQGQFLRYTYLDSDGETKATYVDLSNIIVEAEAGDGLAVSDTAVDGKKAIKVKIASTSENYSNAVSYTDVTEYNEDKGTSLTEEEFNALDAFAKIKTPAEGFLSVSNNGVAVNHIKDAIEDGIDAVGSANATSGKMITGIIIAHDGITLQEDYIPTVVQGTNTVNGIAPTAGTPAAEFSTITVTEDASTNEYTISHNIKTVPLINATAPSYYSAEEATAYNTEHAAEIEAGTVQPKQTGDLKDAGNDGLTTANDVKEYVNSQIVAGTSFITNAEVEGLFEGILSAGEINTIDSLHTRS